MIESKRGKTIKSVTIKIPRNFDSSNLNSLDKILSQYNNISPLTETINFDFHTTEFMSGELSSFVGALFEHSNSSFPRATISATTSSQQIGKTKRVTDLLLRNNLLSHYISRFDRKPDRFHSTLKYSVINLSRGAFTSQDTIAISNYLKEEMYNHQQWNRNFASNALQIDFESSIFEIARNTSDHSRTSKIIFSGQYYPNLDELRISIADLGIGIPYTVFNSTPSFHSDSDRIDYATQSGMTSRKNEHARGLGLFNIKETLKGSGEITIISKYGTWKQDIDGNVQLQDMANSFPGTIINITLRQQIQNKIPLPDFGGMLEF